MSTISEKERHLRVAQADDALAEIHRQRRIVTGLYQFKKLNVSGTGNRPNTRMWTLFTRFNHKTKRYAERYRTARHALTQMEIGKTVYVDLMQKISGAQGERLMMSARAVMNHRGFGWCLV